MIDASVVTMFQTSIEHGAATEDLLGNQSPGPDGKALSHLTAGTIFRTLTDTLTENCGKQYI